MTSGRTIGFLSDFGTSDWFVGVVKAVILSINPSATIVDITHEVPNHDVLAGAFALQASYAFFPEGSVIIAVVDPGVGSSRDMICVRTQRWIFLAPDNGILTLVLDRETEFQIYSITNERFFLKPVSKTFHARDILAPIAAQLSLGMDPAEVGPRRDEFTRIDIPRAEFDGKTLRLRLLWIDSFGNLITSCENALSREVISILGNQLMIMGKQRRIRAVESYSQGAEEELIAVEGSSGFLEIASFCSQASKLLGAKIGDELLIEAA